MNLSIGAVTFTKPLVWTNRDDYPELAQSRTVTVGGGQVVFTAALQGGRPIVLEAQSTRGWVSKAQVDALRAMAVQIGSTWTLVYGAESHDVEFDYSTGAALSFTPLIPRTEPASSDWFTGTILLRTV
jgi:hypothetical protein